MCGAVQANELRETRAAWYVFHFEGDATRNTLHAAGLQLKCLHCDEGVQAHVKRTQILSPHKYL
jgi:hypothetical protein